MKKEEKISIPAAGGSSLLVIFGVLCLVVLSLLSLSTVLAEKRISEASAEAAADWYAADLKAQEVFAALRTGQQISGVVQAEDQYSYSVPISGRQTLQVVLKETDGRWVVVSWQAKAHPEDGDKTLPVWQGH